MYEIHEDFVKKSEWFQSKKGMLMFKDYEFMLTVIGLIRFALQIRENIVENDENIDFIEKDE